MRQVRELRTLRNYFVHELSTSWSVSKVHALSHLPPNLLQDNAVPVTGLGLRQSTAPHGNQFPRCG